VPPAPGITAVDVAVPETTKEYPVTVFVRVIVALAEQMGKSLPGVAAPPLAIVMEKVVFNPGDTDAGLAEIPVALID
jgi:hypothetical protein